MEPIVLVYRDGESMVLERTDDRIVLRSRLIRLELPGGNERALEWCALRGEELERTLAGRLRTVLSRRIVHRPNERDEVLSNAYAALEISAAFERFGFGSVATTYRSVYEHSIAYAYQIDPNRETN